VKKIAGLVVSLTSYLRIIAAGFFAIMSGTVQITLMPPLGNRAMTLTAS